MICIIQALEALNKKDLTEIKSYTKPPDLVEMVMRAVMILRNSEPSWTEAKRQLGKIFVVMINLKRMMDGINILPLIYVTYESVLEIKGSRDAYVSNYLRPAIILKFCCLKTLNYWEFCEVYVYGNCV